MDDQDQSLPEPVTPPKTPPLEETPHDEYAPLELKDSTFMGQVVDDALATGRTASLLMGIHSLQNRRAEQTRHLDSTYLAIGTNAEDQCEWLVAQHEAGRDDPVVLTGRELLAVKEAQAQARDRIAERDEEVNTAKNHLAEEERKQTELINSLDAAYRARQEELKKRQDEVTGARAEISAIHSEIKKLQARIEKTREADTPVDSLPELEAKKTDLESSLSEPTVRLELANEKRALAKNTVDAKNAELKAARANWRKLRGSLMNNIKGAQAAQSRAVEELRGVDAKLTRAHTNHGKALFDSGELPQTCLELAQQGRKTVQTIAEIDDELARKQKALRKEKGGAKRLAVLACVVLIAFVLGLLLGYAIRSRPSAGGERILAAAKDDRYTELKYLLADGVSPEVADEEGRTPLCWAARNGGIALVKLLLDNGADVNASDQNGQTALHAATGKGQLSALQLLIDRGADVNARDKAGKTALDIAVEHNFTTLAEFLKQHSTAKGASAAKK